MKKIQDALTFGSSVIAYSLIDIRKYILGGGDWRIGLSHNPELMGFTCHSLTVGAGLGMLKKISCLSKSIKF